MKQSYLTLVSTLDKDVRRERKFEIKEIKGEEGICRNFEYQLKISSLERLTKEDFEQLSNNSLTVQIAYLNQRENIEFRYINGFVYRLTELGNIHSTYNDTVWVYEVELSSWLKRLQYIKDCRIFQSPINTPQKIVTGLLNEMGFFDIDCKKCVIFPRLKYATIYQETLYNFIVRILLDSGILFYFHHTLKEHTLILFDDSRRLASSIDISSGRIDTIKRFYTESNLMPIDRYMVSSFQWDNPPVKNVHKQTSSSEKGLLHYEYPGRFKDRIEGDKKALRRVSSLNAKRKRYRGSSTIRALTIGKRFSPKIPIYPEVNEKPFLLIRLEIDATDQVYKNEFLAIPAFQALQFHPDELVKRPTISGFQTAFVVGPENQSNRYADKLGRITVRFHWDHNSESGSFNTSAMIRVASPGAGRHKGLSFTPEIGDEVIVVFEDGDPDKPLIIGSVYSEHHRPQYNEGDQLYKSFIKSQSDSDANQIFFDDKKNNESLSIQGKKDLNLQAGSNYIQHIKNQQSTFVSSKIPSISGEKNTKDLLFVAGDRTVIVNGENEKHFNQGDFSKITQGNLNKNTQGNSIETVGKDFLLEAKGKTLTIKSADTLYLKAKNIIMETGEGGFNLSTSGDINMNAQSINKTAQNLFLNISNAITQKAAKISLIAGKLIKKGDTNIN